MSKQATSPHRLFGAIALCLVAILAVSAASGCGSGTGAADATTPSKKPTDTNSPAPTTQKLPGEKIFKTSCASCHDAVGKPNMTQQANPSLVGIWTTLWSDTNATWDDIGTRPSVRLSDELYKERIANLKAENPEHYEANKERYERILAIPETEQAKRFIVWLECRIENGKFDAPDSAMLVPPMKDDDKQKLVEYLQSLK